MIDWEFASRGFASNHSANSNSVMDSLYANAFEVRASRPSLCARD